MGNAVSLTGQDTVIVSDRVLTDFADQDCGMLEFENDLATVKTGKNGNSIYAQNTPGNQAKLTLRLLRGSGDDKFMNGLLQAQQANFSGMVLLTGEFNKKVGDGRGNITTDSYLTYGGIFTKIPGAKTNAEGDTEQSVAIYTVTFSNGVRAIT